MAEAGSSKSGRTISSNFDTYNTEIQGLALEATKLAAGLPPDVAYHRTVDSEFAKAVDICSEKALRLANKLISLASNEGSSLGKGKARLEEEDDVTDRFGSIVVDVLDQMFERVDTCLDEHLGRHKPAAITINAVPKPAKNKSSRNGRLDSSITHASHLPKPQSKFKRKIDNTNDSVWSPSLKHKYNAQVPLGYSFVEDNMGDDSQTTARRNHPYHYEIKHISYPKHMFEQKDPIAYRSFDETPFTWVATKEILDEMINKLRQAREIAVDLEHHSYRTFQGFLCLMQISTRDEDFIVDTLKLREDLEELNEVFTDPKIVKVFHGAESDIVWLQQDFNLYIVNLFDTFHASKLLAFSKHGLAALLEMYCDFIPDKRYQLADWRIRHLPTEMLHYARSDTHFLLYIYDCLRNALIDRGGDPPLINAALARSEETSLRTYAREYYDAEGGSGPSGWDTLALKWNKVMAGEQLQVFKAVHAWRDRVAREEDESTRYVLPNHYIFQLAEQPPIDMPALLAKFRPVPPLVRAKASNLLDTIREAVKAHGEEAIEPQTTMEIDNGDTVEPTVAIDTTITTATSTAESSSSTASLWTKKTAGEVSAVSSTLLGDTANVVKDTSVSIGTSQSSLFPSGWLKKTAASTSQQYQEVVARIHKTLVVAPGSKVPVAPSSETIKVEVTSSDVPSEIPEQIEIPFVPATERQTKVATVVEDTIVVVGQPRQKKRKRTKAAAVDDETKEPAPGVQPSKKARSKDEEASKSEADIEPFDYANTSNLLDDSPAVDTEINGKATKKGKFKKGRGYDTGGFPSAPRANHEVRSGNQSHTFK